MERVDKNFPKVKTMNGRNRIKRGPLLFLLLFLVVVCACGCGTNTPIEKILNNPRDYGERPVTISGKVVDVFSLVVVKYFIVRDGTGELAVVTERPVPRKGSKVRVTGTVQEAFSLGDKQLIVLVEKGAPPN
jgi:hypothetical protein